MVIVLFIVLILVDIIVTILSYPLALVVVPFATSCGWLPTWLWWFQTPDNSLDGDSGWKSEHLWFKDNNIGFHRYINRVRWLWRNSMHGFKHSVLGFRPYKDFVYTYKGNQNVSNRPLCDGLIIRWVKNSPGRSAFQFYYVKAWSTTRCLRINLGWKIWQSPKINETCQYVCSINPFMGFSKEVNHG
jgi:hypothetical protein